MKGHEQIVRSRLAGITPRVAFVNVGYTQPQPPRCCYVAPDRSYGDVYVEDRDNLRAADWRFAWQLPLCMVHGDDSHRVRAVAERLRAAGAKRVMAVAGRENDDGEVVLDTAGIFAEGPLA